MLLGTAAALWRSIGTTLDGYGHLVGFQRDCERQARQALGETAFQAAYHRGLEMPAEDALAYALQQPPKPPALAVPDGALLMPGNCRWPACWPGAAATRRSPPSW